MIRELTLYIAVFLAVLTIIVPRKHFMLIYIIAACFIPRDQRIIIMELDFTVLRILVVSGILRIILRKEYRNINWNILDKAVFLWVVCGSIIFIIQYADKNAVIYKSGVLFDVIGMYWIFRQNICSWDDIKCLITAFSISAVLMVPFIAIEWTTNQNPFVILGKAITEVRIGRLRCQGAFPHSIIFGVFWATLVPLFVFKAMTGKNKLLYWGAILASLFFVIASASSTPLGILIIVLMLIPAFKLRHYARHAAWGLFLSLLALHMIMKAPVWHLMARVTMVAGSTGWHRYHLIEQAIKHFDEWALLGTKDTTSWDYRDLLVPQQYDITNQYVYEGVRGGLITLIIFIVMLIIALKILRNHFILSPTHERRFLAWCICCSMVGHYISFIGLSYFGQILMLWYLMLAIVGFMAGELPQVSQKYLNVRVCERALI
jgi:hypothetical protein